MLRILLVVTMITLSCFAFGQNGYVLPTEKLSEIEIQQYEFALNHADLSRFRKANERTQLVFKSGIIVELLSVSELEALEIPYPYTSIRSNELSSEIRLFTISDEGILIHLREIQQPKS